jgi:hypothetical protein
MYQLGDRAFMLSAFHPIDGQCSVLVYGGTFGKVIVVVGTPSCLGASWFIHALTRISF